jgi:pectin methylesterase-like acyl-CoA thioesterase
MFPVTITLHDHAQLHAVMAALATSRNAVVLGNQVAETAMADTVETKPAPKAEAPGKPSAAKTAPSPRTAEAAPSPAAQPAAAPAPSTEATPPAADVSSASPPAEFDYATLQKAVVAAAPKHGKAKLLEIAVKHGAPDFKSLPASAWAAAHADVIALG